MVCQGDMSVTEKPVPWYNRFSRWHCVHSSVTLIQRFCHSHSKSYWLHNICCPLLIVALLHRNRATTFFKVVVMSCPITFIVSVSKPCNFRVKPYLNHPVAIPWNNRVIWFSTLKFWHYLHMSRVFVPLVTFCNGVRVHGILLLPVDYS